MLLLLLMIGGVLIAFLIVQGGFLPGSGDDRNALDKAQGAIDEAKETKQKLESKYKFDPEEQERSIDDMN